MPPRKARDVKSAAPSPSPALRSSRSRSQLTSSTTDDEVTQRAVPVEETVEETEEEEDEDVEGGVDGVEDEDEDGAEAAEDDSGSAKPTLADRQAKLKELRLRMNATTAANRRDLVEDHQKSKVTARELQRLEKQRKLAQTLRLKADADETGEDLERRKAWKWSIEQNERWEKKQDESKARGDSSFHNENDDAFKRYERRVRGTKVDLVGYSRQKEAALGLAPGTLVPLGTTSSALAAAGPSKMSGKLTAAEDLYRTADTLSYGDNKPSEEAIDRVMDGINKGMANKRRKKEDDDDTGDVTYINKRNKHFNKKVARYFDKYTKDIKANLERGTAL